MNLAKTAVAAALGTLFATAALAQSNTEIIQRNVNQQQRIEQGLQSGQLTVQEAGRLEREESRVGRMQANALRDGTLSAQESARINGAQDRVSRDIARESHDAQTGNPNSPDSRRMQADVQRNIKQQQRIENGVRSGQLTNREAARAEYGASRIERTEGRAARDGNISRNEQRHIQSAENRESRGIYREQHDAQQRGESHRGWQQASNGGQNNGRHNGWSRGMGNPHRR